MVTDSAWPEAVFTVWRVFTEGYPMDFFSSIPDGKIPQDVEVVGNHIHKPWSWKPDHPDYGGIPWLVKNLLEIKAAKRVLLDGNVMENVWTGAQHGQVLVVTPRAAEIEDVTIRRNVLRNFQGVANLNSANVHLYDVLLENNVAYSTNSFVSPHFLMTMAGTPGKLLNITIRHNTMIAHGNKGVTAFNGSQEDEVQQIDFRDNLISHGKYGIFGNGKGVGLVPVQWYCRDYDYRRNALIGGGTYREDEHFREFLFPENVSAVGFANSALKQLQHFALTAGSPFKRGGTDKKDIGADIDEVFAATACTEKGACKSVSLAPSAPTRRTGE